jgi:hypothetical protein
MIEYIKNLYGGFLQKEKLIATNFISGFFLIALTAIAPETLAYDARTQHIEELENKLQEIQNELIRIKAESTKTTRKVEQIQETSVQTTKKVEHIHESMVPTNDSSVNRPHKTILFFRGGFARSDQHRNGISLESRVAPVGAQEQADRNAWYVGAGFDFSLTPDVWGFLPRAEVIGELMFEYKQFGNGVPGNVFANEPTQLAGGTLHPRGVTVNQFTLTAAPKIKFLEGSKFRPWIIPAGLAIHVISPPSESVTYVNPGIMFAGGAEYNIWKDFYLGADARYQLVPGGLDGANFSGMTVGGYIGIGF